MNTRCQHKENSLHLFFSMLFLTLTILSVTVVYKIIQIGSITVAASSLIIPFMFLIGDMVAELFGPTEAKRLIWFAIGCKLFYVALFSTLAFTPSPLKAAYYAKDYLDIGALMPRAVMGGILALILGYFINIHIILKRVFWGKHYNFLSRYCLATTFGDLGYSVVTITVNYLGIFAFSTIAHLIIVSYCIKITISLLSAAPVSMLVAHLRKKNHLNAPHTVGTNPFSETT